MMKVIQASKSLTTLLLLCPMVRGQFTVGDLFVSSSLTDEVRIYDSNTLEFKSSFSHPEFVVSGSPAHMFGPNGMVFNGRGNLVVAAYANFVELSAPGVEYAIYPKIMIEATETLLLDRLGNLYTTTATTGSDQLNQYSANTYVFQQTIDLPAGAGQLTGIVFDTQDRLFVASQTGAQIHVLQADPTFTTFTFSHSIASGNASNLEGLLINRNSELVAAGGDLTRYNPDTGVVLGSFDAVGDAFPVAVTSDNIGNIFTADFENGYGSSPADLFRFTPDGSCYLGLKDPNLYGPFGMRIFGANSSPGVEYCFGNGAGSACPCGNLSSGCQGCANSTGNGARLRGVGSASVSSDDLVLIASGVGPGQNGIVFAGPNQISLPFGDGHRCVGGTVIRFPIRTASGTGDLSEGPGIAAFAGLSAGQGWNFQAWYRDPQGPCGSAFNLSNAIAIMWTP